MPLPFLQAGLPHLYPFLPIRSNRSVRVLHSIHSSSSSFSLGSPLPPPLFFPGLFPSPFLEPVFTNFFPPLFVPNPLSTATPTFLPRPKFFLCLAPEIFDESGFSLLTLTQSFPQSAFLQPSLFRTPSSQDLIGSFFFVSNFSQVYPPRVFFHVLRIVLRYLLFQYYS